MTVTESRKVSIILHKTSIFQEIMNYQLRSSPFGALESKEGR